MVREVNITNMIRELQDERCDDAFSALSEIDVLLRDVDDVLCRFYHTVPRDLLEKEIDDLKLENLRLKEELEGYKKFINFVLG